MPFSFGFVVNEKCAVPRCERPAVFASRALQARKADVGVGERPEWRYWEPVGGWLFWCEEHRSGALAHATTKPEARYAVLP